MFNLYQQFGKRAFDFIAASFGGITISPIFIVLAMAVKWSSKGPVFYKQERIGKGFQPFIMYKFRSMVVNNASKNQLVTATGDPRITTVGKFLRRYKLDELPQLFNVIRGDMSLVGPRPEVMRYIEHYKVDYEKILQVKPGITDNAAIAFKHEEKILAEYDNSEVAYIKKILPMKIRLYHDYISKISFIGDIKLILKTIF